MRAFERRRKPIAQALAALALVSVALGAGSGCSDDFEPYSRLSSLRVLGIAGDPAAPATGETTTLSAIVFRPTEEPVTYTWRWCPLPGSWRDGYTCKVTEGELAALLGGAPVPAFELGSGPSPTVTFTNGFAPSALMSACALAAGNALAENICNKGFPIEIRVDVTTPSHPKAIVALRTLYLRFDAGIPANANPQLGGLTATIGGVDVPITDDLDPMVTLPRSRETEIKLGLVKGEAEIYTLPPKTDPVHEYLLVSWFVESGDLDDERTAYQFDADEKKDDASIEKARINKWQPGKLEDYLGDTARIVVVVRDGREGISFVRGRVRLGDVQ